MDEAKIVDTLTILVEVKVYIRRDPQWTDGYMFDWYAENGDESEGYFQTEAEAIIDAQERYL